MALTTVQGVLSVVKAWVNFNGATGAIRASQNISSVTRNSTGDYTVNIASAMADTNYTVNVSGSGNTSSVICLSGIHTSTGGTAIAPTTTSFRFVTTIGASAYGDPTYVLASVFGN